MSKPETASDTNPRARDENTLRALSRSPHPYHRQNFELLHTLYKPGTASSREQSPLPSPSSGDDSTGRYRRSTDSDSGTEADDEHFLRGLPAPRSRPRKGLRGSATPSPVLSATDLSKGGARHGYLRGASRTKADEEDAHKALEKFWAKRRTEVLRRVVEVLLLLGLGHIVYSGDGRITGSVWEREFTCQAVLAGSLLVLYPVRLIYHLASRNSFEKWPSIVLPAAFDPAALLYPPLLTNYVTTLLSFSNPGLVLPNIILGTSSLLTRLLPSFVNGGDLSILHWFLSCIPLFAWQCRTGMPADKSLLPGNNIDREVLVLLYPLHRVVCAILEYLTTTSLLETEVQLLSIALINILLLSTSPQMVILKALLWGGGLALLISCGFVLRWMVALERVPKWRFKRSGNLQKHALKSQPKSAMKEPLGKLSEILHFDRPPTLDSEDDVALAVQRVKPLSLRTDHKKPNGAPLDKEPTSAVSERPAEKLPSTAIQSPSQKELRRHTLPITRRSRTHTPSGRKKRSASSSLQGFYNLTETQATIRKYLYASYVYISVLLIILVGIREYVGRYALDGAEPVGWALAYMFGNIHWVRMQVLTLNLQRWIPLPERIRAVPVTLFQGPWIALLRENFGTANTRLLISGYWLLIIIAGLAIVTNLSSTVEVDTRRKVFHFMMVAMLLPATYIDPCFAALALALVLAIFLLLDLFRASQLPPLSKPLAHFLTPYVDGRDLRGPVVISHIFLLIGCAIPLWLSLGAVERENGGWEAPTRDVSMVSGVICVGMGDAAASLIGRRYGRHKWLWPGGKSLEGSAAFAVAVATALVAAKAWLRIGGWADGGGASDTWTIVLGKAAVAAGMASATEAVLTGGNDNVVVPVVLWLCVKGLRI